MDHLLRLVEERGLRLVERAGPTRGGYDPASLTIRLAPGMSVRTTTSVLAHELGHAALGHTVSRDPEARARQERSADEWAATLLISPVAYARAEALRGTHRASLAFELGVTVELLDAYRRMLERIGDAVYVSPRMGSGQWAHRVQAGSTATD